jgi:mono/diheme cytochrome c family protein
VTGSSAKRNILEDGPSRRFAATLAAMAFAVCTCAMAAVAQSTDFLSTMTRYPEQSGEQLYRSICQGCHLPDARGATGAGAYPALADDAKLEASGYAVLLVMRGRKDMPAFAYTLSDEQIAAVVNYIRSHFGNAYKDEVTVADVNAARP